LSDQLVIPRGALVVLIGAAGVGKTTFAARHFPREAVLSSDAFRAAVGAGEADQSATRPAFAALHRALEDRLARGLTTVVDATNVSPGARAALLTRARRYRTSVVAIVLDLPPNVALARNAARPDRVVPEGAVRRQLRALVRSDDQTLGREGFALIARLRSAAAVGAFRVVQSRENS